MNAPRILIVEDEGILAKGLEHTLKRHGYAVAGVAASGEDAVALAAESAPDLVLMDVKLRGAMDGIQAAEEIHRRADVPVIYLTAYADRETLERAKGTTPHGYLVKPFEEKLLSVTIEMVLTKHRSEKAVRASMAEIERVNGELTRQKLFFETLFEFLPCGVLVVGRDNTVRAANPYLLRALDISGEEILRKRTGEALRCAHAKGEEGCALTAFCTECPVQKTILEAFQGRPARRVKADLLQSGPGAVTADLLVTTSTVRFEEEELCIVILEDVTELNTLRELVRIRQPVEGIVGQHETMLDLFTAIHEVAETSLPVLIQGESGSGKELVATAIHAGSPRARGHFVAVNCGALPEGLLESELFGHVKGAFTGAIRDKKGRFELADGGTLFLDEIGELSQAMQVKLLRVLQDGTFERVGGERTVRANVRLVCATNKDLRKEIQGGRFREDLFYRLAVMPIHVPPLRERLSDLPALAAHILGDIAREHGREPADIAPEALALLMDHGWPGNVRELENTLQYATIKSKGLKIEPGHLPPSLRTASRPATARPPRRQKLDAAAVSKALEQAGGNKVKTAKLLRVGRATLYRFLEEHPIAHAPAEGDSREPFTAGK